MTPTPDTPAVVTDADREKAWDLTKLLCCLSCGSALHCKGKGGPCYATEKISQALADERAQAEGEGYQRGRREGRDHWAALLEKDLPEIRAAAWKAGQERMKERVRIGMRDRTKSCTLEDYVEWLPIEPPPQTVESG